MKNYNIRPISDDLSSIYAVNKDDALEKFAQDVLNDPRAYFKVEDKEDLDTFVKDEVVLYKNGNRYELGVVKSVCGNNEYFVNYHMGDTAARTHARNLHKISNSYAFDIVRKRVDD